MGTHAKSNANQLFRNTVLKANELICKPTRATRKKKYHKHARLRNPSIYMQGKAWLPYTLIECGRETLLREGLLYQDNNSASPWLLSKRGYCSQRYSSTERSYKPFKLTCSNSSRTSPVAVWPATLAGKALPSLATNSSFS